MGIGSSTSLCINSRIYFSLIELEEDFTRLCLPYKKCLQKSKSKLQLGKFKKHKDRLGKKGYY